MANVKRPSTAGDPSEQEHLQEIARESLEVFEVVSAHAEAELKSGDSPSLSSLAYQNTLHNPKTLDTMRGLNAARRHDLLTARAEPAIARLVVLDDKEQPRVLFISKGSPPLPSVRDRSLVSYKAPMGRLASLRSGEDIDIRIPGKTENFYLSEKVKLRPTKEQNVWDSPDTIVDRERRKPITIQSLRALVEQIDDEAEALDLLDQLIRSEQSDNNVLEGIKRSVIDKMALREQPILDQIQDEIFRLPINSKLAILGPPGTGKTTTLIKRLGQKLEYDYLDASEKDLIDRTDGAQQALKASWMMFTPTELLRLYVKEAFLLEGIVSPDTHIKCWDNFRREVARGSLGILRTANSPGFTLKEHLEPLLPETFGNQRKWFEDFDRWQKDTFWSELEKQAGIIDAADQPQLASIKPRLKRAIGSRANFRQLLSLSTDIAAVASLLGATVKEKIRKAFALALNKDKQLLDRMVAFLKTLDAPDEAPDEVDELDLDEEEQEVRATGNEREAAFDAYEKAARAGSLAAASKRSVRASSKNGQILSWLGPDIMTQAETIALGQELQLQRALRAFVSPIKRYVQKTASRYRQFRREMTAKKEWYQPGSFEAGEVCPIEVDAVMLAMQRAANNLLRDTTIVQNINDSKLSFLKTFIDLRRIQIVVDEATDFSPIQLACMHELCNPSIGSFLACGDFNQRITGWGSRNEDDLKWACPGIDTRRINVTYRHSEQLNKLAREIAQASGAKGPLPELPPDIINNGVDPVAVFGSKAAQAIPWLAARIIEVERLTESLPSIALLVNAEEQVQGVAAMLDSELSAHNIKAVPCPLGQTVGQDNDVRVFSVQYIKGLEFEAVFFLGIDELAEQEPELFDKFLYVGATRAATYFGITCSTTQLPKRIQQLRPLFHDTFGNPS